jgi:hypothetical protein
MIPISLQFSENIALRVVDLILYCVYVSRIVCMISDRSMYKMLFKWFILILNNILVSIEI